MSVAPAPPMSPNGVAQQQANNTRGFVNNTAFWSQQMADITRPVGGGLSPSVQLPRVGLLARLRLAIRGSVAGTLTVPNALGMASIINRIRLSVNAGLDLVSISGWGYHYGLREGIDSEYGDPVGQSNARSAVTATTYNLDMVIPIAINLRDPIGLINLQDTGLTMSLFVDWTADATVATGATVTGTVTPYLDLFTLPPDPADYPNLRIVQTIVEDQRAIAGAGDYQYDWLLGSQYLQIYHLLGIGAAGADAFSRYQLRLQQNQFPWISDVKGLDIDFRAVRFRARPAGLILVDRMATSGLGNYGLLRDMFDSSKITDASSIITATGAGTLYTLRRGLQALS
jgi:hypothetical protein